MNISEKDIKSIAKLACIKLLPEEIGYFASEIDSIMHWIDRLQELDVSDIHQKFTESIPEREDVVTERNQVQAILANAPEAKAEWFVVPKMIKS